MKKRIVVISLVFTFLMIGSSEMAFAQSSASVKNPSSRKIELFNGKNLDGWYTFIKGKGRNTDPNRVFQVQKDNIVISGEEFGCITSNDEYENYKLLVEYRWGERTFEPRLEKARDSGVLIHSTGEDGGYSGIWMFSIECQLIEGGTGDLLVVGDGTDRFSITCPVEPEKQNGSYRFSPAGKPVTINSGRINWIGRNPGWKDVKGFRGFKDMEKRIGKWNKLECIARDNEIFVYLNGTLVNYAMNVKPQKGKIQIQSEGAEIIVRKVNLTPLFSHKIQKQNSYE